MMFKPLSDALGLVIALSFATGHEASPAADTLVSAPTRWGALSVERSADDTTLDTLTLNGLPVEGVEGRSLWIVAVEPVSPEADRAVIATAEAETGPPTVFRALLITPAGARLEEGGLAITLRGTARMP